MNNSLQGNKEVETMRTEFENPEKASKQESKQSHPAIVSIVNASWAAKFWFVAFWVAVGAGFIAQQATVTAMRQRQFVSFIGRDGSIVYAPLQDFGTSEQFAYFAKQAMRARFEMNPAGLSNPELLKRLINPDPRKTIENDAEKLVDELRVQRVRNFSQFVNVLDFTTPQVAEKNGQKLYFMRVTAQLDRDGVIDGIPFSETPLVIYDITFMENPDIANNGFFPLVVVDFQKVQPEGTAQ